MILLSFCSSQRAALLFLLLSTAASGGCSRFTRTKQCRALIAQVNPALDEVITITGSGGSAFGGAIAVDSGLSVAGAAPLEPATSSGAYLAAAGRYERLAKQLGPMEFATEDMAKTVAEYASVLHASAQDLRALAAALDANNYADAERVNRDLERLSGREHVAIARIDNWCAPGS